MQCILRHENVTMTQHFYIKTAPQVAQEAMRIWRKNCLYSRL